MRAERTHGAGWADGSDGADGADEPAGAAGAFGAALGCLRDAAADDEDRHRADEDGEDAALHVKPFCQMNG